MSAMSDLERIVLWLLVVLLGLTSIYLFVKVRSVDENGRELTAYLADSTTIYQHPDGDMKAFRFWIKHKSQEIVEIRQFVNMPPDTHRPPPAPPPWQ